MIYAITIDGTFTGDYYSHMDQNIQSWCEESNADWVICDTPPEEGTKPTQEQIAATVRHRRDEMLKDSDWSLLRAIEMGEGVPTDWSNYRQALRDVPQQQGFPEDVTWPELPE